MLLLLLSLFMQKGRGEGKTGRADYWLKQPQKKQSLMEDIAKMVIYSPSNPQLKGEFQSFFEPQKILGKGAFSTVIAVKDRVTQLSLAVKVRAESAPQFISYLIWLTRPKDFCFRRHLARSAPQTQKSLTRSRAFGSKLFGLPGSCRK